MKVSLSLLTVSLTAATLLTACDAVREAWEDPELEAALRSEPGRGGKVGTLRALDVRRSAREAAVAFANPVERACDMELDGARSLLVELVIERTKGDEMLFRWDERRRLDVSPSGAAVSWDADYITLANTQGKTSGAMIVDEGAAWVGRAPGPTFYRRDDLGRDDLLAQVEVPLDQLLGLARWRRDGPARWVSGDAQLRCSARDDASPWFARIEANDGRLVSQRFEVDGAGARRLELEWLLPDGTGLSLRWDEEVVEPEPVEPPSADAVVEVERDLSYELAHEHLRRWESAGIISSGPAWPLADEED